MAGIPVSTKEGVAFAYRTRSEIHSGPGATQNMVVPLHKKIRNRRPCERYDTHRLRYSDAELCFSKKPWRIPFNHRGKNLLTRQSLTMIRYIGDSERAILRNVRLY